MRNRNHGVEEGPVPVRRARFVALLTLVLLCVTTTASWARETERSRYDRESQTERMLASILKSAPSGIGVVEDRVMVEVNDYILNLTGYAREELIGQNARMLYPTQEDSDYVGNEKYRQIKQKGTGSVETRWMRKDGAIRHVILSSTPLDPDDIGAGVTFTVLDISERKLAEERLQESEERFRTLFDNHAAVMLLLDPRSGAIRDANPAAAAYYGWPREQLVEMHIQQINVLTAEEVKQELQRAKARERTYFEFRHRRADGSLRDVAVFSSDIPVGAEILLFSIIHDITDQKQAEAALAFRTRWFLRGLAAIVALLLVLVGKLVLSLRQRKTALTALGESQESLATTLNSIGDGVIATNREGRVANMNPVAETLCGWPLAEAKGRPLAEVFNIVHSHTRQPVEDPVQKVLDSRLMVGLANHTMLIARHGRTYQISDSAAPIRDRAGVTTGVVLVFSDVTEKYAQSEKLRRSEELLSEMARQVPGVLFQFYARSSGEKGLYYISEKSETLFGIRAETDGYFERFAAMVLSEYREGFLVSINKAVADCSNWYYEGVIRKPTGEQIWFSGHSIPTQRENETIFNGLLLDITARKRAEKDAEDSRSLLQSVLDTIPVRVFWKDLHLRYLGCNMPFAKDAGKVSPSELIGKDDYAMGWRDQAELYRGDDKAVIETGAPKLNFEEPQTTPDGRAIYLRTSKIPLRNSQGEILGVLGTYEDITERKSTEAERAKLQAQLFHAQKMESLGTLAGGVAHDFNNLLQAMGGSIELLLKEKPPGHPDTMRLHTVARSVDRASQLIQQLLLFGRKAEARKIRVDLNHEVKEVFRILERTTPKMIAVTLDLDPDARPIFADPVQIEQILLNLASNAVDAMPQGGRLVVETRNIALDDDFARTHPGSRTGWHVRLSVTDTGCGMGTGVLQHVFDPFFTTKSPGKGTGLGLASVYGIVKAHGGHILCYSEPNQGTTFKVYLPVAEPDAASAAPARRGVPPRGGTETILAVDDEPAIRELAKAALASYGYTVYSAGSGEEALTIYQEYNRSIDLVLLDLNMPGMGGYRCLQELLQLDNAVKVIIASGYSANGPGMEVTSSGARGFIGKPYQLRDLAAKVREVLDDKSSGLQDG